MTMEMVIAIGGGFVMLYLAWLLTKALVKTLIIAVFLAVAAYLLVPLFAGEDARKFVKEAEEKGQAFLEDAREMADPEKVRALGEQFRKSREVPLNPDRPKAKSAQ